jgi:hypothetical protein
MLLQVSKPPESYFYTTTPISLVHSPQVPTSATALKWTNHSLITNSGPHSVVRAMELNKNRKHGIYTQWSFIWS